MSTKPYDEAFKFLAEQDAKGLLLLLGDIRPGEEPEISLLPREISISSQLPDQPYEVTIDGKTRLVHKLQRFVGTDWERKYDSA